MANSDNVVRAGLTPKLKDIETLCKVFSFKNKSFFSNIYIIFFYL